MSAHRTMRSGATGRVEIGAATAAVVAFVLGPALQASAALEPPGPATGHAAVIAQGVIEFAPGAHHWSVGSQVLEPAGEPLPTGAVAPYFLVADEGVALVAEGGVPTALLAPGEATFVDGDGELSSRSSGAGAAGVFIIELLSGGPSGDASDVGDAFDPGQGLHDVDLVSDVIVGEEATVISDAEAAPILLLVIAGTVNVATDANPEGALLAGGEARTLDGELTITNAGDEPADIVAAVVGPLVIADPPTTTTTTTTTTVAATTTTLAPTTSTSTSTSTTPTTAPADSDADGLTDADEAIYGTDPSNPDTDGDAIDDGAEVNGTGTDPNSDDTDSDGLGDYAEIDMYGTDPNSADTDVDGATDSEEVNFFGTDPLAFDSDGDGIGDGAEVLGNGTDPNNPDTDGDGLDDGEEGLMGTDPLASDTDGDGVGDGAEVGAGTDPLDPTSF